jgi:hypothetical protein
MGILDELIDLVKETIDEAKQRQQQTMPPQSSPAPAPTPHRSPEDIEALKRTLAQRAMKQRAADEAAIPITSPDAKHRAKYELERARLRVQHQQEGLAKVTHNPVHRAASLLKRPETLRDLIILKELLDRPISMRRGHRR